jgi:hypothetical protein
MLLNWPPYLPDLNLIEHLWLRLKEQLYLQYLWILDLTSKADQLDALIKYLPGVWDSIALEVVHGCLNSMPNRIQAVIDA